MTEPTISVVIPARNEAATVADVVGQIARDLLAPGIIAELVVIDSDSTDDTASVARAAGATVVAARDVDTGLAPQPGKGEALWKSLFVTSGEVLVFIDADLTEWGTHFVTGLIEPMRSETVLLTKGYYDRLADDLVGPDVPELPQGGRVTELVARPLLNLWWPELADIVQPLAGEWAIRRSLMEQLPIPVGYGVEFATLVDTWARHGREAIAQVDLGRRGHRHQNVHDLGVMAAEILATAMRRLPSGDRLEPLAESLQQFDRSVGGFVPRRVPLAERPAAVSTVAYRDRSARVVRA